MSINPHSFLLFLFFTPKATGSISLHLKATMVPMMTMVPQYSRPKHPLTNHPATNPNQCLLHREAMKPMKLSMRTNKSYSLRPGRHLTCLTVLQLTVRGRHYCHCHHQADLQREHDSHLASCPRGKRAYQVFSILKNAENSSSRYNTRVVVLYRRTCFGNSM